MADKKIALVLGGGGAAGNAWLIGVVAGLAEGGFDLTELADLVIGTSAGANAAVQVLSGTPPAELLAAVLAPLPPQPPGQNRLPQGASPMDAVFERMRAIGAAASSADELQHAMAAYGLERDSSFAPEIAEKRRAMVGARLPTRVWPQRPLVIVAVNAETGELATFDRNSGVELVDAATAAISLPGAGPTHVINGTRYVSGGIRSNENADLAMGYAQIVVLSPLAGREAGATPAGQFEGLRRFPGADLAGQAEALRRAGSRVEIITPEEETRTAMGNLMDIAARAPAARAGFEQGKREAARLLAR